MNTNHRRALTWSAALLGLAVLGVAVLWALSLRPGITRGNTYRIPRGASEAEVEALLGRPAGVYTSEGDDWAAPLRDAKMQGGHARRLWVTDDGAALVDFNGEGLVTSTFWVSCRESFWDVLRPRLGF